MDLATLIGIPLGVALILFGIYTKEREIGIFADAASLLIVFGGTFAALLVSVPLQKVISTLSVLRNAFFSKPRSPQKIIRDLVSYAEIARRNGILSLESMTDDIEDEFIVEGIRMAVDGTDPELMGQILGSEIDAQAARHRQGKQIFEILGKYAPAFGMIGTLIGLVIMLNHMDEPSKIGPAMAVAIITTFYGVVAANLIFLPIADKLALRSEQERQIKQIILRGITSIQSGDNPRIVEQKLKTFLPAKFREEEIEE